MKPAIVQKNESPSFFRRPGIVAVIRGTLGVLLAFGALNAFGGGFYGLSGARDIPKEWLAGSPFTDYFIPSFILFFVVGGSMLLAAVAIFAHWRKARLFRVGCRRDCFRLDCSSGGHHRLCVLDAAHDGDRQCADLDARLVARAVGRKRVEGVYQAAAQIGASVGLTQRTKVCFRRPP
jgi:hypothetical protein